MTPARIELEIEELVLHGFEQLDAQAVRDAVAHELTTLLGSPRARTDGAGTIRLAPRWTPESLGRAVAAAVFAELPD